MTTKHQYKVLKRFYLKEGKLCDKRIMKKNPYGKNPVTTVTMFKPGQTYCDFEPFAQVTKELIKKEYIAKFKVSKYRW